MTYYEWASYLESLEDATITDEIISKINNYNFNYPPDVMIRLTDHIINAIIKKLVHQRDYLTDNLDNIKTPQELTLQINDLKVTLNDANKLLTVNLFNDELINSIRKHIINYSNQYIQIIKKYYNGTTNNDYSIIINNLKLMEEK